VPDGDCVAALPVRPRRAAGFWPAGGVTGWWGVALRAWAGGTNRRKVPTRWWAWSFSPCCWSWRPSFCSPGRWLTHPRPGQDLACRQLAL